MSGEEFPCNSSGNTQSQSSQLAEPLWTDPGLKSGISVRELIKKKKEKKAQVGNEKPRKQEKATMYAWTCACAHVHTHTNT